MLDLTPCSYLALRKTIGNDSYTTQETNEGQSTNTRNPDVKRYMCIPQRHAASSHVRDSESCSKQPCRKSRPTTKSTHKLIIYAYHEPQDQTLPTMSEHATTNQLNTQVTKNHKCKPNDN